ncbi:MAG: hypothetical protein AAGN66_07315 [Acidobacteriota bacterium]
MSRSQILFQIAVGALTSCAGAFLGFSLDRIFPLPPAASATSDAFLEEVRKISEGWGHYVQGVVCKDVDCPTCKALGCPQCADVECETEKTNKPPWYPIPASSEGVTSDGIEFAVDNHGFEMRQGGRSVHGLVQFLTKEFFWEFAKANQIVSRSGDSALIEDFLRAAPIQSVLGKARAIVAIGTASCQGDPKKNFDLAMARAERLGLGIKRTTHIDPNDLSFDDLYYLNLGRRHDPNCQEGEGHLDQRVVAICYLAYDGDVLPIDEGALRRELQRLGDRRIHIDHYTAFELDPANYHTSTVRPSTALASAPSTTPVAARP